MKMKKFQSVSGLWDRRNQAARVAIGRQEVSIRLRSVGPEKSGQFSFYTVRLIVSIRLRSVGPEKFRSHHCRIA